MMKTTALLAIVAAIANAAEEFHTDNESTIINTLSSLVPEEENSKFYTWEHPLGEPAMHPKVVDSK